MSLRKVPEAISFKFFHLCYVNTDVKSLWQFKKKLQNYYYV